MAIKAFSDLTTHDPEQVVTALATWSLEESDQRYLRFLPPLPPPPPLPPLPPPPAFFAPLM
jgi:hypothetical protein